MRSNFAAVHNYLEIYLIRKWNRVLARRVLQNFTVEIKEYLEEFLITLKLKTMLLKQFWNLRITYLGEGSLYFIDVACLINTQDLMKCTFQVNCIIFGIGLDNLFINFYWVLQVVVIEIIQETNSHYFIDILPDFERLIIIEMQFSGYHQSLTNVI